MAKRTRKEDPKDGSAPKLSTEGTATNEPKETPARDPKPSMVPLISAPPAPEKAAPPPPKTSAGVVMGPAAHDPTRANASAPIPVSASIYCGLAGIRSPVNAGFTAWAQLNGHNKNTRAAWGKLFQAYKADPVRS